jgi:Sec-independent protein translocase protein TatA
MPPISDFFTEFGWPEIIISLVIVLIITGVHELKNVIKLFKNDTK